MDWWDIKFFIDDCVDLVKENPVKTSIAVGMTVAGAAAFIFAPPIAVAVVAQFGSATASTGTLISTLSGAAATNASLAAIGGGALTAGGAGMAGGTVVITSTGTVLGGLVSGTTSRIIS